MPRAAKAVPATPAALAERFKDFPAIDILERRLVDPSDPGSLPILLKDEAPDACTNTDHQHKLKPLATRCAICKRPARKWYVRFANTAQEGRWAQIKAKGYVAVEVRELRDEQDVADLLKRPEADDAQRVFVRRGDRGQEILVKQPLEYYLTIKRGQREQRMARAQSATARRNDLAESAGSAMGDEAGQSIYDGLIKEESFSRKRSSLADEAAGGD